MYSFNSKQIGYNKNSLYTQRAETDHLFINKKEYSVYKLKKLGQLGTSYSELLLIDQFMCLIRF